VTTPVPAETVEEEGAHPVLGSVLMTLAIGLPLVLGLAGESPAGRWYW